MQQIVTQTQGLIPSGAQYWNKYITAAGGDYIAYASTLAIYLLNAKDYTLYRIIAKHNHNITSLIWNLMNPLQFSSTSKDKIFYIWDVNQDLPIVSLQMESQIIAMTWNPQDANEIGFIEEGYAVQILNLETKQLKLIGRMKSRRPTIIKWNMLKYDCIALGNLDCSISYYQGNDWRSINGYTNCTVLDLEFDPKNENYLLVSYSNGKIRLFDIEGSQQIQKFEKQQFTARSLLWNPNSIGEFFTASEKQPVIRKWQVTSQGNYVSIKVGNAGIKNLVLSNNKIICQHITGGLTIYSLDKNKIIHETEPGHSETIFDIQVKPDNPNIIASCSYDGTVKIWELSKNKNIATLSTDMLERGQYKGTKFRKQVVYGISWGTGDLIAACTFGGQVILFDYSKNMLCHRFQQWSDGAIYRIRFSNVDRNILAIGTPDNKLVSLQVDQNYLHFCREIALKQQVVALAWSPIDSQTIAVGSNKGLLQVYDFRNIQNEPILNMQPHSQKIFNISWNPVLPSLIATASDDQTIQIINYETQQIFCKLQGHSDKIRPVVWHPELPWLLLSGSWDSTIKMWDVRINECIYTAYEHYADIYGIDMHPQRPFTVISCSRDSSIRIWSLLNIANKMLLQGICSDSLQSMVGVSSFQSLDQNKLMGSYSRQLINYIQHQPQLDKYEKLLGFMNYLPGTQNFFDLIQNQKQGRQCAESDQILPVQLLRIEKEKYAVSLITLPNIRFLGTHLSQQDARLQEAAQIFLQLGNVREYCEIMIKLQNWKRALAFAPGHSQEYWTEVLQRYSQYLENRDTEQSAMINVLQGQVDKTINEYILNKDYQQALILASAQQTNITTRPISQQRQQSKAAIQYIYEKYGNNFYNKCSPILSSCGFLAKGDPQQAFSALVAGNQLFYAFVVNQVYNLRNTAFLKKLAKMAFKSAEYRIGASLLSFDRNLQELYIYFASQFDQNLIEEFKLSTRDKYYEQAQQLLPQQKYSQSVQKYIIGDYPQACQIAVELFKGRLQQSDGNLHEMYTIWEYLQYGDFQSIDNVIKAEILAISALLGALKATWEGCPIAIQLAGTFLNIQRHNNLRYYYAQPVKAVLDVLFYYFENTPEQRDTNLIQGINKQLLDGIAYIFPNIPRAITSSIKRVIGNNLPANQNKNRIALSVISRKQITGAVFKLDEQFGISIDEALMWEEYNAYSPMNDGTLINPY